MRENHPKMVSKLRLLFVLAFILEACNGDTIFNISDAAYSEHSKDDDGSYMMTPSSSFPFFGENVQNFYVSFCVSMLLLNAVVIISILKAICTPKYQ